VLSHLRTAYPDAVLACRCAGPEKVTARYGIPASRLHWYDAEYRTASTIGSFALKAVGKVVDAVRSVTWVRSNDVVIVPGMGVLEATLPLRPWGFPYSLFLLCASGRLVGTPVALVSVGADVVQDGATRLIVTWAARLAAYRSYRDEHSRDAMRIMGVDVSSAEVYPDLAFALPAPCDTSGPTGTVGVGVMAYHGGNDDRARAAEIYSGYLDTMTRFVRWLVDSGRHVRLFIGDHIDGDVVREIITYVRAHRPDGEQQIVAEPAGSLNELMQQMATVDTVVATRYHNILCALKLSKPTISLGYAAKNDVLMASMGLEQYCQSARSLDLDRLIEQFQALESRRTDLIGRMAERNRINLRLLDHQFAALADVVRPQPTVVPVTERQS
jgi:polysaccharide pyruvyl transferase WcaK-like protein